MPAHPNAPSARARRIVNRNTGRLAAAVILAWLIGALGGLAIVPFAAFVPIFVAVLIVPLVVALWDRGARPHRYP